MELHLLYLYPNLLNLYGDIGNLKILKYRAECRGINVIVHSVDAEDKLSLEDVDIVLLGDGQASEMSVVASQLARHTEKLKSFIENNGVFLAIGGGYQLFGNQSISLNGEAIKGLEILPIYTEIWHDKFVGDVAVDSGNEIIVGFENHMGKTKVQPSSALGKVLRGHGNNGEDGCEGFLYKNFFGTNLHGPLLAKSPELADKILLKAVQKKYDISELEPKLDDTFERKARETICSRLGLLS